jgi:hypothetical protein
MTLPEVPDLSQFVDELAKAPGWMAAAMVAAATMALLVGYTLVQRRRAQRLQELASPRLNVRGEAVRQTVAAAGPLALLGACGMLVSLYGLFGFATESMELPVPFAVPFMAIWDLAEAVCFVSLYRSALVESRWTRPMRQTRRMAWGLVCASAAMNAAHAPGNAVSMVVFALVPAVSAKLIEHELDKLLSANADEDEEDTTPGLVRLFQLGYVHIWAGIFARLGLDATSRDGLVHQDARIRRAARQIHALGQALDERDQHENTAAGTGRRAQRDRERTLTKVTRKVEAARGKAELAIDVAGIAGDISAQLMLARHLTTRGRVGDLARMDKADPVGMVALLEDLSIVPSAAAIQEGARAAQAKKERQEAEQGRDAALAALEEARQEAAETRRQVADELAKAKTTLERAHEAKKASEDQVKAAEDAKAEAEQAKREAAEEQATLTAQLADLRSRTGQLKTSMNAGESRVRELSGETGQLQARAEELRQQAAAHERAIEQARDEMQRAADAKRDALTEATRAQAVVDQLTQQATDIERDVRKLDDQRREQADEIARLATERDRAAAETRKAQNQVTQALTEAQAADGKRRAAVLALQNAHVELLEALTSPEDTTAPRWTSEAKVRGWELYLHKVHTEGCEPTDGEMAGEDRDASTARRWRSEFRAELARITAADLPAQRDAHDRTADRVPALT